MLTATRASQRHYRSPRGAIPRVMRQSDAELYHDLAQASGGQAIEVTKSDLSLATRIIEDSSAGAVVGQQTSKPYLTEDDIVPCKCMVFYCTKPYIYVVCFCFFFSSGDNFSGSKESWKA